MKNITKLLYTTIFSLLLITVFFTIAELNIIAKTVFTNQLEQSVVMNASYLIACKLLIQIAITYYIGSILYKDIKSAINKRSSLYTMRNIHNTTIKNTIPFDLDKAKREYNEWLLTRRKEYPLTPDDCIKPEIKVEPVIGFDDFKPVVKVDEAVVKKLSRVKTVLKDVNLHE